MEPARIDPGRIQGKSHVAQMKSSLAYRRRQSPHGRCNHGTQRLHLQGEQQEGDFEANCIDEENQRAKLGIEDDAQQREDEEQLHEPTRRNPGWNTHASATDMRRKGWEPSLQRTLNAIVLGTRMAGYGA